MLKTILIVFLLWIVIGFPVAVLFGKAAYKMGEKDDVSGK